jgi:arsenite-transporting ATPase
LTEQRQNKFLFFSGKGGVGKTSMASASAVYFADRGERTLIVTTDPASNLADVFEQKIGHEITKIQDVDNLWAIEIDSDKATADYKESALRPLRGIFPEEMLKVFEEQLNSPCTEEMAAFDKFIELMHKPDYEVIIFDTAPTGHTLRLLELPVDWSRHIKASQEGSGQTCMGPVTMLEQAKEKYEEATRIMKDTIRTKFVFVVQPESTPVTETKRSAAELEEKVGIKGSELVINGVLPKEECADPFFKSRYEMQMKYVDKIRKEIPLPTRLVYLKDTEIRGLASLRRVASELYPSSSAAVVER